MSIHRRILGIPGWRDGGRDSAAAWCAGSPSARARGGAAARPRRARPPRALPRRAGWPAPPGTPAGSRLASPETFIPLQPWSRQHLLFTILVTAPIYTYNPGHGNNLYLQSWSRHQLECHELFDILLKYR